MRKFSKKAIASLFFGTTLILGGTSSAVLFLTQPWENIRSNLSSRQSVVKLKEEYNKRLAYRTILDKFNFEDGELIEASLLEEFVELVNFPHNSEFRFKSCDANFEEGIAKIIFSSSKYNDENGNIVIIQTGKEFSFQIEITKNAITTINPIEENLAPITLKTLRSNLKYKDKETPINESEMRKYFDIEYPIYGAKYFLTSSLYKKNEDKTTNVELIFEPDKTSDEKGDVTKNAIKTNFTMFENKYDTSDVKEDSSVIGVQVDSLNEDWVKEANTEGSDLWSDGIIIPDEFDGKPVLKISPNFIENKDDRYKELKGSISIPESVQTIGASAFSDLKLLSGTIRLPNVTSIGENAFKHCMKISLISVTEKLFNEKDKWAKDYWNSKGGIETNVMLLSDTLITEKFDLKMIDKKLAIAGVTNEWKEKAKLNPELWTDLIIPKTINGETISIISQSAFKNLPFIGKLDLGSVEIVDANAFEGVQFTSVESFASVRTIGSYAFSGTSISGNINLENVTSMANFAFNETNITGFVWSTTISRIPNGTFQNCTELKEKLTFPSNVVEIGPKAFSNTSISGILEIPSTITKIGDSAFANCAKITNFQLSPNVTEIPAKLFYNCIGLAGDITIPNTVIEIGESAFQFCRNMTSVSIGIQTTEIGASAFRNCSKLAKINIEEIKSKLSTIGEYAFSFINDLSDKTATFKIPRNVRRVGSNLFAFSSFKTVYAHNRYDIYRTRSKWSQSFNGEVKLYMS
ncbi:MAG: leucine-rich repeat protein [Mycoplasma sp.]